MVTKYLSLSLESIERFIRTRSEYRKQAATARSRSAIEADKSDKNDSRETRICKERLLPSPRSGACICNYRGDRQRDSSTFRWAIDRSAAEQLRASSSYFEHRRTREEEEEEEETGLARQGNERERETKRVASNDEKWTYEGNWRRRRNKTDEPGSVVES